MVDSLRPVTAALWRSLAPREQARFARRHARRWEVHRSRTAPAVAARIAELRAAGMLRVEAAEVRSLRPADGGRIACEVAGPLRCSPTPSSTPPAPPGTAAAASTRCCAT